MVIRPQQENESEQQIQNYQVTIAQQWNLTWKDSVTDVWSLPSTWNVVGDSRTVLADWFVRKRDWADWVLIAGASAEALLPRDASGWAFPTVTAGESANYIISVAGTLPAPVWAVEIWDWILWDGYVWTHIPNTADQYVNTTVDNVAVWGLPAWSWPFDEPVTSLLDRFLYPFIELSASLWTSPTYNTYYENWVDLAPSTLSAIFVNSQNPIHPVEEVLFKRWGVLIDTKTWANLTSPQTFIEAPAISETTTFSCEVKDDQPVTKIWSRTYNFVYPMYGWNSVADDYLNRTDLASIEAVLATKKTRPEEDTAITDTFTNARNIFVYPASYGDLTSIIDWNWFETISNYDKFTKSYTTRDWNATSYNIYQIKSDTSQTAFINNYNF